jgi:DNA-binding NarL/FixJ family response regulator
MQAGPGKNNGEHMQTVRALLKNNMVKFIDDVIFPLEDENEYVVLVTFIGKDLNSALFGEIPNKNLVVEKGPDPKKAADMGAFNRIRIGMTWKELEVLKLVQKGFTNLQISAELNVRQGTARNYVSSILKKLDAPNRTGAIAKAIQLGLLE